LSMTTNFFSSPPVIQGKKFNGWVPFFWNILKIASFVSGIMIDLLFEKSWFWIFIVLYFVVLILYIFDDVQNFILKDY